MDKLALHGNQQLSDYYGPLLTQHIRAILESGLLLDEDYEVLLKASNFKIYTDITSKLPLGLIAGAATTLASIFIAKRYDLPFVIFPPLALTLGLLCLEQKSMIKHRRHKEITNYLVKSLIKLQKLNSSVIRYTKLRKELSGAKEKEILLHNANFEAFIKFFIKKHQDYFLSCLRDLEELADSTSGLSEDFLIIKQMDVESLLGCDYSSFNDYFNIAQKVQDVYIFLSSKLLNYIALTFCKNLNNTNAPELELLLNKKLPNINACLNKHFADVHKEFNNLRYCTSKKMEIDTKNKRHLSRHVSGKLQQTLISAVDNLSIIMEKSQAVLHKVESAENENDIKKLEGALSDLRDHAFATYESLDVLCKLYGIFSEANKCQNENKVVTDVEKLNDINQDVDATLSYDDSVEALEENYELFIPENDISSKMEEQEPYVDQSGLYLNLMLRELRQSLKQHDRFIAARDKRGIKGDGEDSDNDEAKESTQKTKKPTPKFDLSALQAKKRELENTVDIAVSKSSSTIPPLPPPRPSKFPPPPPPPPSFNLTGLKDEGVSLNKRSLFENIRTLSSQIQGQEEIFGSDDSD